MLPRFPRLSAAEAGVETTHSHASGACRWRRWTLGEAMSVPLRAAQQIGFGVPTLIAVHPENDPNGNGLELAKAYAAATGGHRAGVLESSFVAEVKSDLMGEQTILCGMLQTGAVLSFDKMVANGIDAGYASKLIQYG